MQEIMKKLKMKKVLTILVVMSVLLFVNGCATVLSLLGSLGESSSSLVEKSEADEDLETIKTSYEAAKEMGTPYNDPDHYAATSEWDTALSVALSCIDKCNDGDDGYLKNQEEYESLASEIVLAYEQFMHDSLNAVDDPYWAYNDIFYYLNEPFFEAHMKDSEALFTAVTDKWIANEVGKVQDLGNGVARDYVNGTGEGLCWFGTSEIPAESVDYNNLQWIYDDVSQSVNVSFITKAIPDNYLRFGPDKVKIYYQVGTKETLLREYPVNNDGTSDEYTMSFPLKLLDNEVKKAAESRSFFNGDYIRVTAYYYVEELDQFTSLGKSAFFLKRK
ncbi:MAG: hypothetical protein PQJ46_05910 [Spirochaetales bacterium]|nr:hypothetical protein [Spirochaetales bacterium]